MSSYCIPTPLTDAIVDDYVDAVDGDPFLAMIEHARTLERENASLRAYRDYWHKTAVHRSESMTLFLAKRNEVMRRNVALVKALQTIDMETSAGFDARVGHTGRYRILRTVSELAKSAIAANNETME